MFKDKNVLVTGGTGMIGRELIDILLQRGANITVCDLFDPCDIENIKFIKKDLRYLDQCMEVCKNKNFVFNLVGIKASPKMCAEQPADIMVPMMMFNTNMMHAAMSNKVEWYLYTSSVGVYQPAEVLYEDDVWSTQPSKNDWYGGWAKRIGELQAGAYGVQYKNKNISIVRPANVYGRYDNFDPENAMVIPALIRKAHKSQVLEVWGDGTPIRDFIHAKDVARGMIHAVENKIIDPINLGSGDGVQIKTIAETIAREFNRPIKWLPVKSPGDPRRVFDMTRAKSYGFNTTVSIEQGIKDTIDWFLKNKDSVDNRFNAFKKEVI